MTVTRRSLIILALASITVVASLIDAVVNGWTVLGGICVAGFVLVIALALAELSRAKHHS